MIIHPMWTCLKLQKAYHALQCLSKVIVTQLIYTEKKEGSNISFYKSCLIRIYSMLSFFSYIDSKLFDGCKHQHKPQND